ncbi:MAG: DUF3124 domain-containing protein [Chloroflexota bacterium]
MENNNLLVFDQENRFDTSPLRVRYDATVSNLIRDYINESVEVSPLATTGFLVEGRDRSGGWGSNFILAWAGEEPVYVPVIEAFMVITWATQGISMISLGRVISQTDEPQQIDEN